MEQHLKERLVGAVVLVVLAVIFVPLILSDEPVMEKEEKKTAETAPEPDAAHHSSIVPIEEANNGSSTDTDLPVIQHDPLDQLIQEKLSQESAEVKQLNLQEEEEDSVKSTSPLPVAKELKKEAARKEEARKEDIKKSVEEVKTEVGSTEAWVIQLGSFSSEANAKVLNERLLKHKFPSFVEPLVKGNKVVYRVRVGPTLQKSRMLKMQTDIKNKLKLDGILVKYP